MCHTIYTYRCICGVITTKRHVTCMSFGCPAYEHYRYFNMLSCEVCPEKTQNKDAKGIKEREVTDKEKGLKIVDPHREYFKRNKRRDMRYRRNREKKEENIMDPRKEEERRLKKAKWQREYRLRKKEERREQTEEERRLSKNEYRRRKRFMGASAKKFESHIDNDSNTDVMEDALGISNAEVEQMLFDALSKESESHINNDFNSDAMENAMENAPGISNAEVEQMLFDALSKESEFETDNKSDSDEEIEWEDVPILA